MKSTSLAITIKLTIIEALQSTGIIVIASVSDQFRTDLAANNIKKNKL